MADNSRFGGIAAWLGGLAAVVLALITLIRLIEPLRTSWCENVGLFCVVPIQAEPSGIVKAEACRGDHPPPKTLDYCLKLQPDTWGRLTDMKFVSHDRSEFFRGEREPDGSVGMGYTVTKSDSRQYCVRMWAESNNCVYLPGYAGHIEGKRWITLF